MFVNNIIKKFNNDIYMADISVHSGVPKQFYDIKNKKFHDWEIAPWELFIFTKNLLGEGSFAKVYLAQWRETIVVAKVINKEVNKELIIREIDIMSKLHHPNIVQFLGFIDNPFIIVMEYIPNNNLSNNIKKLRKKDKISIMKDILKALTYLHNRLPDSLIHRDIKPTNILLTNSKTAKITDFGLSKFYNFSRTNSFESLNNLENTDNELTKTIGTERYMAPELLKKFSNYNNKIDIFSCGILLYEMFENKKYLPGTKLKWFWCPKNIRGIIENYMLCDNPDDRYDALTLLKILNRIVKSK